MVSEHQFGNPRPLSLWLPFTITFVGIVIAFSICFWLVNNPPAPGLMSALRDGMPWIILILCLSLAIQIGLAIRVIQLTKQLKQSFAQMNTEFQREISIRLHAEETKQKLEKALLQGQKLQAIGTLAGGIAHDFNNILYAIIGFVQMAREDVQADSPVHKNLGKVLEASQRGQELVSRILAFGRRQHHDFKVVCIQETMEGVLSLLKPTIPASVAILLQSSEKDIKIFGNDTQLHQVMVNIINNAVDAMDGEGHIDINISRVLANDELLKQFLKMGQGSYCKIVISDTGHGMDQSMMERIFEPFYTTKEVGKGTGLGLATVHSIVKEHKGEIIVESQLGRGSTFTILLPEYNENGE